MSNIKLTDKVKVYNWLSPVGYIHIKEENNFIIGIGFGEHNYDCTDIPSPLINTAVNQLSQYFKGERKNFQLPIKLNGTDFQKRVWQALLTIPYGETRCYGEIAKQIGNPKGQRAVGMANNKNPISIVVPCHRVIGKNGNLTGYAGGLNIKEKLLNLEYTFLENIKPLDI